ncbi:MmgE/PrpD family protein [Thermodesulfobacteriota bacterium]
MTTVCERLVNFAWEIQFEDLPSEVTHEAERRVLDALGCMIAGSMGSTSQQVKKVMIGLGGVRESSIIGTLDMTSCEKATLVNCTFLRFLDYMDGHLGPYPCHVCFNIPPILAIAERVGANGKQLVTAIVTAYEIMPRFNKYAPSLAENGWAGGTNLEFSVPLAVSPMLGLDRDQTVNALGMSITHGNALNASSQGQMPASKSILDGMTTMNAVVAVLLAQQGITGPPNVVEGPGGYVGTVSGECDYEGLLAPIERHKILETRTKWCNTIKCGQSAVAAALQIIQEHNLSWRDIAELQIGLTQRDSHQQTHDSLSSRTRPNTRDTANHSVWFSVAAAIVEGELGPDQFKPEKLNSQDILDLIDRTSVYWEKAHDAYWPSANPATIKIRTTDGQDLSKTLLFAPGHPRNPLPDEALEQKFRQLSRNVLNSEQIEAVIETTHQLADLSDIRILTQLVRPQANT